MQFRIRSTLIEVGRVITKVVEHLIIDYPCYKLCMIHNANFLRRRKLNRYKLFLLENFPLLSRVVLFSL